MVCFHAFLFMIIQNLMHDQFSFIKIPLSLNLAS
jgi:hypothetical protein